MIAFETESALRFANAETPLKNTLLHNDPDLDIDLVDHLGLSADLEEIQNQRISTPRTQ